VTTDSETRAPAAVPRRSGLLAVRGPGLLPVVLGFPLALEAKALPREHRMRGPYRWLVTGLCALVMGFGPSMLPVTLGLL
jgi:hypothetical protein